MSLSLPNKFVLAQEKYPLCHICYFLTKKEGFKLLFPARQTLPLDQETSAIIPHLFSKKNDDTMIYNRPPHDSINFSEKKDKTPRCNEFCSVQKLCVNLLNKTFLGVGSHDSRQLSHEN